MSVAQLEPVKLLHVKEVARVFDVGLATAYRWIASGDLPATKVGGTYRVHPEVVERLLSEARGELHD